jgi:hypothetical protein
VIERLYSSGVCVGLSVLLKLAMYHAIEGPMIALGFRIAAGSVRPARTPELGTVVAEQEQ